MLSIDTFRSDRSTELGPEQKSYALVRPEDAEVCILARGELKSSDMSESWYSRTISDLQSDMREADR
jgi:hypothetical protein